MSNYKSALKIGFTFLLFVLFSCKKKDTKPDSLLIDDNGVKISLEWSVEGESKPVEHTDLDLGLFKESDDSFVSESVKFGAFEEISLAQSASNLNYIVKVKRFENKDDKQVNFTVKVRTNSGGDEQSFSGSFTSTDIESSNSWTMGAVKSVVKIEKSGNEFNVVNP